LHRYTYSIATLSWIDPKTGLPEVDVGSPGETILRERILGNSGYRFANFLEATVEVVNTSSGPAPMVFSHIGYSVDSGLYRAPSFLGFPSYPYPIQLAKPVQVQGGVEFRQTVGARTQSAELAAGKIPVGGAIGGSIAQKLANFPPIWTELKLTIFYDGTFEGELMAHSLFPSVSYYENSKIICLKTGPTMSGCQAYERKSEYDGNPNLDRWFRQDKGWGARKGFTPAEGNPWGVTEPDRNVIFGQQPPNPNEEVRRPREYPSETWRPSGR